MRYINPDLSCSIIDGFCQFNSKCEDVPQKSNNKWNIKIIDSTHANDFDLEFLLEELLIPGHLVGKTDNICVVSVFKSGTTKGSNVWLFGGPLFEKFYVVYDMTPHNERAETYAHVGLGTKNTANDILKSHYDTSFAGYHNYTDD